MSFFTGIDRCPAGWVAVTLETVREGPDSTLLKEAESRIIHNSGSPDFIELCRNSRLVLIDIPVGLPGGKDERESDRLVRKALGKRGSSIFPVPVRDAVYADSYHEACDINFRARGKKLSKQSWNIVPAIREIDKFLLKHPAFTYILRESSPEYAFLAAGGRAPAYKKRDRDGMEERIGICEKFFPETRKLLTFFRRRYAARDCQHHDVLDALILAVTAALTESRGVYTLPDEPMFDEKGIPIQAMFCTTFQDAPKVPSSWSED